MAFDADAFVKAREPWTLTIDSRAYEARPISVQQVLTFQSAIELAGADQEKVGRALTALLRLIFPPRWSYLWRGDPVRKVLALDAGAQSELLADFFGYMARTIQSQRTTTRPSPPSSAPTPPPTTDPVVAPV